MLAISYDLGNQATNSDMVTLATIYDLCTLVINYVLVNFTGQRWFFTMVSSLDIITFYVLSGLSLWFGNLPSLVTLSGYLLCLGHPHSPWCYLPIHCVLGTLTF